MAKRLTPEEQDAQLEEMAWAVKHFLTDTGCFSHADNQKPDTAIVDEICDGIGAARSIWYSIRQKMIELDIPLALQHFGGYYIGKPGDQWTLLQHKKSMIEGVANSLSEDIVTICRNGGTIDDVKERGNLMMNGQFELADIPKVLKALNCPLPKQIETALLEAG